MERAEQKALVTNLCDSIRNAVLEKVDDRSIPEDWNGLELRQLLAEMFWRERGFRFGRNGNEHPTSKRVSEYRNLVITSNLDR